MLIEDGDFIDVMVARAKAADDMLALDIGQVLGDGNDAGDGVPAARARWGSSLPAVPAGSSRLLLKGQEGCGDVA